MKKFFIFFILVFLCSCATLPTVRNVLENKEFRENTYSLKLSYNRFGKISYKTIYLMKIEPGFDTTIANSLKEINDIEGAIRYIDIMMQQYKDDMRVRAALNISFLYYVVGDRDKLEEYYQYANRNDFSDETASILKKMTILYPKY